MQTKLTLRLEDDIIRWAKRYACRNGTSLSRLIADYFQRLGLGRGNIEPPLTPAVRRLSGLLRNVPNLGDAEREYLKKIATKHL